MATLRQVIADSAKVNDRRLTDPVSFRSNMEVGFSVTFLTLAALANRKYQGHTVL